MSDNPAEETPKRPRKTPELPPMPAEMLDALGGAPIPVPPSMRAGRVAPGDRHAGHAFTGAAGATKAATRAINPLFDAPGADEVAASKALRDVRSAYGKVAHHMEIAAALLRSALTAEGIAPVAAREGFDLDAATAIAREFEDFLDRHKPQEAV